MNIEEWKKLLRIDPNNIDEELIQQPVVFEEISEAYILAAAKRDLAKENLANVEASLDLNLRETVSKFTETKIKNLVLTDPKYQEAMTKYLDLKLEAEKLSILKDSFFQRHSLLKELSRQIIARMAGVPYINETYRQYDQQKQKINAIRNKRNIAG